MITKICKSSFINSLCGLGASAVPAKQVSGRNANFACAKGVSAWTTDRFRASVGSSNGYNEGSILIFGTGTTPAQDTDYCLESPIPLQTGYSVTSATVSKSTNGDSYSDTLTFVVVWNREDAEITEIGLYDGYSDYGWLLAREVLKTPISVKNGDTFTVSMTLG